MQTDYPNFELTVIDERTRPAAPVQGAGDAPCFDTMPACTCIHRNEPPGLSRAYNNGIGRTTGEIITFTDDDCVVPSDWISTIAAAFGVEDPTVTCSTARWSPPSRRRDQP